MKRISATEAARRFSDILDAVEGSGETFIVERRGRTVARISPSPEGNGRAVKDVLARAPLDDSWFDEIAATRELLEQRDHDWNA
jgi:antitoxin (DNA-binding transcriptional repressor) of toxin-antitoxin stability system